MDLIALSPPVIPNVAVVTRDRMSKTTGADGTATFTNLVGGSNILYRAEFHGTWGVTTNWYQFPETNAVLSGADLRWIITPTNAPAAFAYSMAAADARFASLAALAAASNAVTAGAIARTNGAGISTKLYDGTGNLAFDAQHHQFFNPAGFAQIDLEQNAVNYGGGMLLINLTDGNIQSSDGGRSVDPDARILWTGDGPLGLDYHTLDALTQSIQDLGFATGGDVASATALLSAQIAAKQAGSQNLTNWSGRTTNSFVASQRGLATNLVVYDSTNGTKFIAMTNFGVPSSMATVVDGSGAGGIGSIASDGRPVYHNRQVKDIYGHAYTETYNPTHDVYPNYPSAGQTNFGMEMQVTMTGGYAFSTAYGYQLGSTGYGANRRAWQWGIGFYGQPYIYHQESGIAHLDNTNLFDSMYPEFFLAGVYTNVGQKVFAGSLWNGNGSIRAPATFFSAYDTLGSGWWRWFDGVGDVDNSGNWTLPGQPRFAIITGPSPNAGIQVSGAITVNGLRGITTNQIVGGTVWQISSGLITSIAPIDSDLIGFFSRMGAVSTTTTNAMITYVSTLKTDGTWTNLDFLYPMVGASIGSNCFNLITNYFNGIPHGSFTTADATGVKSDGSTGYIDTTWRGTNNPNSCGLFAYIATDSSVYGLRTPIGAGQNPTYSMLCHANGAFWYSSMNDASGASVLSTPTFPASIYIQRTSSTSKSGYNNGLLASTITDTVTTPPAANITVCARNDNGSITDYFNGRIQVVAGIRSAMSPSQIATLHNATVALNTALGR